MANEHNVFVGVSKGVLYPANTDGVAWSGLQSVAVNHENPDYAIYLDGILHTRKNVRPSFSVTVESFVAPLAIKERELYGLTFRTEVEGPVSYHQIHLVYDLSFSPVDVSSSTSDGSTGPKTLAWTGSARPTAFPGFSHTAYVVIDTSEANDPFVSAIEDILYGSEDQIPRLPTFKDLLALIELHAVVVITDLGDGTFTAEGPENAVGLTNPTTFWINWPSAVYTSPTTYTVHTL